MAFFIFADCVLLKCMRLSRNPAVGMRRLSWMRNYLHVTDLTDQFKAEEVSEYLGNVVDHRGDTEQSRRATVILKVPKKEGENQPDTETHEPRDEEEWRAFEILELLQHGHPFRDLSHRLSKHFRLEQYEAPLQCRTASRDRYLPLCTREAF